MSYDSRNQPGPLLRHLPDPQSTHQYMQVEMWRRTAALVPRLAWNRLRRGRWLDALVTHAPVFGVEDGPDAPHVGFRAFRAIVDRLRPRLVSSPTA